MAQPFDSEGGGGLANFVGTGVAVGPRGGVGVQNVGT